MQTANQPVEYYQYNSSGQWEAVPARIITETHVTLTINGEAWLTAICTPTDLEAMAVGFLYNEGLIHAAEEISAVYLCQNGTNVDVWLTHALEKPQDWRRTTGCSGGVTSVQTPGAAASGPDPIIAPQWILNSLDQLFKVQALYRESHGVHCSGLSDGQEIRIAAEDIGRHNTLDKLAGKLLLQKLDFYPRIVITTGRISSEMLQKSARMGSRVVISRTSPSSLSIQLACRLGITLVGYARRNQFNVYTHPERLMEAAYFLPLGLPVECGS